jgi:TonB family protein
VRPSVTALLLLLGPALAFAQSSQDDQPVTAGPPKFVEPELIEKVPAAYPKEAAAAGIEGTVIVEIAVDEKGKVTGVSVPKPVGHGFDEAAAAAARRFRYRPATHDGSPIPSKVLYQIRFTLQKAVAIGPPPAARLRGKILARGTRAPVAGVHLAAVGPGGQRFTAETDAAGEFEIANLPAGAYQVTVAGGRVVRSTFDESLAANDAVLTVNYYVDLTWAARYETTVRGQPERVEVSRSLSTEEISRIAGTFGDAIRAVENLPGVARAPFNSGLIIVRGGKPTDSRAFLAAAEVPQLYHFGGFTSVVPTHLVDKIDYFPGNFGARYGRATAGIIDVDLRPGKRDRLHGWGDTNAFDTGVGVEGPIGQGSFILSARRSYVDAVLKVAAGVGGLNGAPVQFTTAPVYYDYQAILDYPLLGGKFRAMLLGSDDVLQLLFAQPADADPSVQGGFSTHIFFHRLQLRWTKSKGPWSIYLQSSSGYNGSEGTLGTALNFAVNVLNTDERLEVRYKFSKRFSLLAGADTQLAFVHLGANVPIPVAEGELPLPISASNKYHADEDEQFFNVGVYAEGTLKPHDRLTITPGLRYDLFSALRRGAFNPRLGVRLQLTPITVVKAGIGLYSQDPQAQDYDKVFGNPLLKPESSLHAALTIEQGIYPGVLFEATAFYKELWDLVVTSNARAINPDGAVGLERKSNEGSGRVYGGEFLLRQSLSKWFFGWISYTLMRSERRNCATCETRLFDFDQTHVLVVALSANLPYGFGAGLRFRFISGTPYTPAHGGQLDSDAAVYIPGQSPVNTARLEPFNQLDLRVDKTFIFERWLLKLYLDVTNVYNNPNQEQITYSFDYKKASAITGLPIIPSFGVRGEF